MPVEPQLMSERREGYGMTVNLLGCRSVIYFHTFRLQLLCPPQWNKVVKKEITIGSASRFASLVHGYADGNEWLRKISQKLKGMRKLYDKKVEFWN